MLPFSDYGPIDRAERKALLCAIIVGSLFIVTLAFVHKPTVRKRKSLNELTILKPVRPTKLSEPEVPQGELNEQYRDVPDNFKDIDFKNYSYGMYTFPNGKVIDLTLFEGDLGLPDDLGWFALKNVYYKDVTGDRRPEAIVRLSHMRCRGSCNGGGDLFYIYADSNGKLKPIWQYETGNYAYGCGLKSLTLGNKQIVLELFGRCARQGMDYYPGREKSMVEDLTFTLFEFDGRRFITKKIEYIPESAQDVKNYEPEIRIY